MGTVIVLDRCLRLVKTGTGHSANFTKKINDTGVAIVIKKLYIPVGEKHLINR